MILKMFKIKTIIIINKFKITDIKNKLKIIRIIVKKFKIMIITIIEKFEK